MIDICSILVFQVVTLMNVDLLRHQQRWKESLNGLRIGFATLQVQVCIYTHTRISHCLSLIAYTVCSINIFCV